MRNSRIAADADFGPGWRLSLAEEFLVDGDAATYVAASGARHAFFVANADNGVSCGSKRRLYGAQLEEQNAMNDGLSDTDRNTADCAELPMYLVVPDRRRVDMYMPRRRDVVGTEWRGRSRRKHSA